MLNNFKHFDTDRMDLDELIALAAFGSLLRAEYEKHQIEEPEFVDVQLKALRREIRAKNASSLEARRKEIKLRLDALKTTSQRKTELEKELKSIESVLEETPA